MTRSQRSSWRRSLREKTRQSGRRRRVADGRQAAEKPVRQRETNGRRRAAPFRYPSSQGLGHGSARGISGTGPGLVREGQKRGLRIELSWARHGLILWSSESRLTRALLYGFGPKSTGPIAEKDGLKGGQEAVEEKWTD
ncbi:unnamed protein product [Linum trigynum]|uniref:Uncharacterized protein n=1 Tax=Linum trigynum TaxID=586398 RepID=A0AAV2CHE5_9ROSI